MPDVKLTVSADTNGVKSSFNDVSQQQSKVAKQIERGPKWSPIDNKAFERDLAKQRQMLADHIKKLQAMGYTTGGGMPAAGGGGIGGGSGGGGLPVPLPPHPAARRNTGRHRYTYSPDLTDVGRNLISGFGGGVGMISQYGTRGAVAGANEGGGMLGGGLGLLKGLGIGTLAFGALKAGQMASEGMDMAKDRGGSLDALKRQLGDLGYSFANLKLMSEAASDGMQINSKEAAKLALDFNRLSGGAEKTIDGLNSSVRSGVGISKAYGLDASAGVNFLGGMRYVDPKQNNRDLAVVLADTIQRSGMQGRSEEVMQAIQSFAQTTSRLSLSAPNVNAYGAAYGSLMGKGYTGMTGEAASSILSQANSSMMRMGGAGEAGMNFLHSAFSRNGALSPVNSMALAEGGLFGTRASVFAKGGPLAEFYARHGISTDSMTGGAGAGVTNLESMVSHLDRQGGSPELKADGLKRLMGLGSISQAAALYNIAKDGSAGGLGKLINRGGIDVNKINTGGLQTLAQIGNAGSKEELAAIYGKMAKRTGAGRLSEDDKQQYAEAAQGGSLEKMQDTLARIAASNDREDTEFSKMTGNIKAIEDTQIKVGDKLLIPLNAMRDALVLASGMGSAKSLHEKVMANERDEINSSYDAKVAGVKSRYSQQRQRMRSQNVMGIVDTTEWHALTEKEQQEIAALNGQRNADIGMVGKDPLAAESAVSDKARGLMEALYKQESGGQHRDKNGNLTRSSKGALGISQVMPKTGEDPGFGVRPMQNDSEEEYKRFSTDYLSALLKQYGGDERKALAAYNAGFGRTNKAIAAGGNDWLSKMPKETQDYVPKIMGNYDGATPMDEGKKGGAGGEGGDVNVNITVKQESRDPIGNIIEKIAAKSTVKVPRSSGTTREINHAG